MEISDIQRLLAPLLALLLVSACASAGTTPPPAVSESPIRSDSAAPTPSASATASSSNEPSFVVKQIGSDGPEVTVYIVDPTASVASARGRVENDEQPTIESEVEPRIGAVPEDPNGLRVLWGGGVCDTTYSMVITANAQGGYHFDVQQGTPSSPHCDTLGVRRGVVLSFTHPVDASTMTGSFLSQYP